MNKQKWTMMYVPRYPQLTKYILTNDMRVMPFHSFVSLYIKHKDIIQHYLEIMPQAQNIVFLEGETKKHQYFSYIDIFSKSIMLSYQTSEMFIYLDTKARAFNALPYQGCAGNHTNDMFDFNQPLDTLLKYLDEQTQERQMVVDALSCNEGKEIENNMSEDLYDAASDFFEDTFEDTQKNPQDTQSTMQTINNNGAYTTLDYGIITKNNN